MRLKPALSSLPLEIIVKILSFLQLKDLLAGRLLSQLFNNLIRDETRLQYAVELFASGLEDNPDSNDSTYRRLDALKSRERAWLNFDYQFRAKLTLPDNFEGLYDITEGYFIITSAPTPNTESTALNYVALPSTEGEECVWKTLHAENQITDFGVSIMENDLAALITLVTEESSMDQRVRLSLFRLSTGELHDLAAEPIMTISQVMTRQMVSAKTLVVGEIVLVVLNPMLRVESMVVINWKKGLILLDHDAEDSSSYHGAIFLSREFILIPNASSGCFEVWKIPSAPTSDGEARPYCSLGLPIPASGFRYVPVDCRAEPNSSFRRPSTNRPFHISTDDSIVLFPLQIADFETVVVTTIAHRSDILSAACLRPTKLIPWDEWGSSISRFLQLSESRECWVTATCGHRFVFLDDNAPSRPEPIQIMDFNPYLVRRLQAEAKDDLPEGVSLVTRPFTFDHRPAFEKVADSRLPYVKIESRELFDYDGVLMDDQRIVGVRLDGNAMDKNLDVFFFG